MRILPAAAGAGVMFRRLDLDGFDIQAVGRNVAKVSYATSLMRRGVLISTTEPAAMVGINVLDTIRRVADFSHRCPIGDSVIKVVDKGSRQAIQIDPGF